MNNISIIIPVYNVAKYLSQCLESIMSQTYSNYEVILVNDGSTDESGNICQRYADKHNNILLINLNRGGVSRARNIGLEHASGKYILFIDSDDYIEPEHLKNYIDNQGAEITYQGYRLFEDGTDETIEIKEFPKMYNHTKEEYIQILYKLFKYGNYFGPTWNKLFKRSIINKYNIRFKEDISLREDEIFTFEYCQYAKNVKVIPTHTYNYRKTPNSLMRQKYKDPLEMKRMMDYSYQAALQLPLTPEFRDLIEKYYTNTHAWMGWMLYQPKCRLKSSDRQKLLDAIKRRYTNYPTPSIRYFIKGTIALTEYYYLIIRLIKRFIRY